LKASEKLQAPAIRAHHRHSGRTTQYLRHPSTLKAVIGVCHRMVKICSHKKFQTNRTSSSRDIAKYVGKITKKEREGKSPKNDQKIKENWPLLRNYWSK